MASMRAMSMKSSSVTTSPAVCVVARCLAGGAPGVAVIDRVGEGSRLVQEPTARAGGVITAKAKSAGADRDAWIIRGSLGRRRLRRRAGCPLPDARHDQGIRRAPARGGGGIGPG